MTYHVHKRIAQAARGVCNGLLTVGKENFVSKLAPEKISLGFIAKRESFTYHMFRKLKHEAKYINFVCEISCRL